MTSHLLKIVLFTTWSPVFASRGENCGTNKFHELLLGMLCFHNPMGRTHFDLVEARL